MNPSFDSTNNEENVQSPGPTYFQLEKVSSTTLGPQHSLNTQFFYNKEIATTSEQSGFGVGPLLELEAPSSACHSGGFNGYDSYLEIVVIRGPRYEDDTYPCKFCPILIKGKCLPLEIEGFEAFSFHMILVHRAIVVVRHPDGQVELSNCTVAYLEKVNTNHNPLRDIKRAISPRIRRSLSLEGTLNWKRRLHTVPAGLLNKYRKLRNKLRHRKNQKPKAELKMESLSAFTSNSTDDSPNKTLCQSGHTSTNEERSDQLELPETISDKENQTASSNAKTTSGIDTGPLDPDSDKEESIIIDIGSDDEGGTSPTSSMIIVSSDEDGDNGESLHYNSEVDMEMNDENTIHVSPFLITEEDPVSAEVHLLGTGPVDETNKDFSTPVDKVLHQNTEESETIGKNNPSQPDEPFTSPEELGSESDTIDEKKVKSDLKDTLMDTEEGIDKEIREGEIITNSNTDPEMETAIMPIKKELSEIEHPEETKRKTVESGQGDTSMDTEETADRTTNTENETIPNNKIPKSECESLPVSETEKETVEPDQEDVLMVSVESNNTRNETNDICSTSAPDLEIECDFLKMMKNESIVLEKENSLMDREENMIGKDIISSNNSNIPEPEVEYDGIHATESGSVTDEQKEVSGQKDVSMDTEESTISQSEPIASRMPVPEITFTDIRVSDIINDKKKLESDQEDTSKYTRESFTRIKSENETIENSNMIPDAETVHDSLPEFGNDNITDKKKVDFLDQEDTSMNEINLLTELKEFLYTKIDLINSTNKACKKDEAPSQIQDQRSINNPGEDNSTGKNPETERSQADLPVKLESIKIEFENMPRLLLPPAVPAVPSPLHCPDLTRTKEIKHELYAPDTDDNKGMKEDAIPSQSLNESKDNPIKKRAPRLRGVKTAPTIPTRKLAPRAAKTGQTAGPSTTKVQPKSHKKNPDKIYTIISSSDDESDSKYSGDSSMLSNRKLGVKKNSTGLTGKSKRKDASDSEDELPAKRVTRNSSQEEAKRTLRPRSAEKAKKVESSPFKKESKDPAQIQSLPKTSRGRGRPRKCKSQIKGYPQ